MQGKGAENFCIFLSNGRELFVRCFHRYSNKTIFERQRYVFAKDGAVRYRCDIDSEKNPVNWRWTKDFREPSFYASGYMYGRYADNSYFIINKDAVSQSDMKYCPMEYSDGAPISFLQLYVKHPNIEYLCKAGYGDIISKHYSYNGKISFIIPDNIDLKSNNLLKMLHLNRTEFKLLKGKEKLYRQYVWWRDAFPKATPEQLIDAAKNFGAAFGTTTILIKKTGHKIFRISKYLTEQKLDLQTYQDYLEQCEKLKYDLHDTAICFPKKFTAMHQRTTDIINAFKYAEEKRRDKEKGRQTAKQIQKAKRYRHNMEFISDGLILRQPISVDEIIEEGRILKHCVGGYADRHIKAQTNIFFIRKASEPDRPYFTIEVSNDFNIIQCHGYKNDAGGKPQEITEFEEKYQKYLCGLKNNSKGSTF